MLGPAGTGVRKYRHTSFDPRFVRQWNPRIPLPGNRGVSTASSGRIPALQPMQNVAAFKTVTVGVQLGVLHVNFDPQTSSPDAVVVEQSTVVSSTMMLPARTLEGRRNVDTRSLEVGNVIY